MLTQLAPLKGAERVIVVEPDPGRRQASLRAGAVIAIDPSEVDPVSKVFDVTKGVGADIVFTACPSIQAHHQALSIVAVRGVVNLFGGLPTNAPNLSVLSNDIHYKEACITGSHGSTPAQHKEAISLIENRKVNLDQLITRRIPLSAMASYLADPPMTDIGLKTIVTPNG